MHSKDNFSFTEIFFQIPLQRILASAWYIAKISKHASLLARHRKALNISKQCTLWCSTTHHAQARVNWTCFWIEMLWMLYSAKPSKIQNRVTFKVLSILQHIQWINLQILSYYSVHCSIFCVFIQWSKCKNEYASFRFTWREFDGYKGLLYHLLFCLTLCIFVKWSKIQNQKFEHCLWSP